MPLIHHAGSSNRPSYPSMSNSRIGSRSSLRFKPGAKHGRITLKFKNPNYKPRTGFMDLPLEIRTMIYRMTFPGLDPLSIHQQSGIRRGGRNFVNALTDRPPLFTAHWREDRSTAIALLLTSKAIGAELTRWLYAQRVFEFISLRSTFMFFDKIDETRAAMIKRVEICMSYGDSNSLHKVREVARITRWFCCIDSLGFLWFEQGTRNCKVKNWTAVQLEMMRTIRRNNPRLTRVYVREQYEQLRFCRDSIRKLPCETEVKVEKEDRARIRRDRREKGIYHCLHQLELIKMYGWSNLSIDDIRLITDRDKSPVN